MPNYRTIVYHDYWLKLSESDGAVFMYRLNFIPYLKKFGPMRTGQTIAKAHVPYSRFQKHSLCGLGFARRLGIDVQNLNFASTLIIARKPSQSKIPEFCWHSVEACFVTIDGVRLEEVSEYLQVRPFQCARTIPQRFRMLVAKDIPLAYICIGQEFFEKRFHPIRGIQASRFSREVFYQAIAKDPTLCDTPRGPKHPVLANP